LITIDNIAPGGPSRAAVKSRRLAAGSTFHVGGTAAADHAFVSDGPSGVAAVGAATLDSLLAAQETGGASDAAAIEQGCSALDLLSKLQRAMLADRRAGDDVRAPGGNPVGDPAGETSGALGRLIGTMEAVTAVQDPRLRGLMMAIRLRGQIEVARRTRAVTAP